MKIVLSTIAFSLLFGLSLQAQKLKTNSDSMAYAVGLDLAKTLKDQGMEDMDQEKIFMAIKDVMDGKEPKINPVDATKLVAMEKRKRTERVTENRKLEGAAYLAKQKLRPEVKELSDGVLYEVLTAGTGPKPDKGGDVTIHYSGMLIDGTVFDSSFERGKPNTFNLKRLVKGWQVALPEMPSGSTWRIYLPYDMAYGPRGAGKLIKPFSTLVFDIELIGI